MTSGELLFVELFVIFIPSFEEGRTRRLSKMLRYLKIGAAGEVRHMLQRAVRPPRPRRFLEVALHPLDRRGSPSFEEGILDF
jgi:hypothetical protein